MTGLLTLPPAIFVFLLAGAVAVLPRRAGHVVAALGSLGVCGWLLAVDAGVLLRTQLFGFAAAPFVVDEFSRLLALTFAFIAVAGIGYGYATGADRRQTAYALAYLGCGVGAAVAGDWLTLVVFWELLAVCATVLVWYRGDRRAGLQYAIYHEIGGLALMAGVLLHYAHAGTFLFGDGITAGLPALLVALGIGLNAGFVGLHVWIVDAYPRAHVATSVVLAAVTTKVGAYTLVRAFPDGNLAIAWIGGAMVLFGVSMAILQTDVRRLLSYHIVSQVGYMVAGFGVGSALASAGAMAHLVNNVLYKSLLFMVAGVLIRRTGKESLKKIGGVGRAMPLTAGVFLVAAFSIAGIPGFNGFVSKGMILDGVEKAGFQSLWYVLLLGGVGTVVSFAKFGYYAFLHDGGSNHGDADYSNHAAADHSDYADLDPLEIAVLGSVAVLCFLLGVIPGILFEFLPAKAVAYAKPFAFKQFLKAGGVTVAGLVVFLAIRSRLSRVTPVPDLDVLYRPLGRRSLAAAVATGAAVEATLGRIGRVHQYGGHVLRAGARGWREWAPALPGDSSRSVGTGVLGVLLTLVVLFALLLL